MNERKNLLPVELVARKKKEEKDKRDKTEKRICCQKNLLPEENEKCRKSEEFVARK